MRDSPVSEDIVPPAEAVLARWRARVQENRAQVERVRPGPERDDFYAPVAQAFRADPRRRDDPTLELLRELVRPSDVVLDIGAGGGRYALPLALACERVIAIEPSPSMRAVLEAGMRDYGIANVEIVPTAWPTDSPPSGDVALMSHVGYDIEEIGPFLTAAEQAARRLCIAVFAAVAPSDVFAPLWEAVHGEPRARLPALPEFLVLLLARGILPEVRLTTREPVSFPDFEAARSAARMRLWVEAGSDADLRLERALREMLVEREGRLYLAPEPLPIGVVSWTPRR